MQQLGVPVPRQGWEGDLWSKTFTRHSGFSAGNLARDLRVCSPTILPSVGCPSARTASLIFGAKRSSRVTWVTCALETPSWRARSARDLAAPASSRRCQLVPER